MKLIPPRPVRAAVVLALLALLPAGCGDDDASNVCAPDVPGGRIRGLVQIGESPLPDDTIVRAIRIPGEGESEATVAVEANASGTYAMDVPAGRYVVGVCFGSSAPTYYYARDRLRYGEAPPDTIVVDGVSSPIQIDFALASMRVHLDVPQSFDGVYVIVTLEKRDLIAPPGAWLTLRRAGADYIRDGALDLVIRGVLPGAYRVSVDVDRKIYMCDCPSEVGERFWMPGTRDTTEAPWYDVPADRLVDVTGSFAGELARIDGEVTGAWLDLGLRDRPLVTLVRPDSVIVAEVAAAENTGRFHFDLMFPDPVKVHVDHSGIGRWVGGERFEDAAVYDPQPGEIVSGIRIVESGLLLDVSGTSPGWTDRPRIRLYHNEGTQRGLAAQIVFQYPITGSAGIPNLRPGTYLMRIDDESPGGTPWAPQWYDRAAIADEAQPITITSEGEVVRIPVVLEEGGTIRGRVLDNSDTEYDYFVFVTPADMNDTWARVSTFAPRLRIEILGLPDGDWKVGVWRRDGTWPEQPPAGTVWYPGTTDWEAAEAIEIRDFGHVEGIEINVP